LLLPLLVAATISVAATTTDLRDLVATVGGDRVKVESLTDPRQDPHAREIHPRQLALLRSADLLVRIGLDHEPWLARAVRTVKSPAHELDASRGLTLLGADRPRLRADARPQDAATNCEFIVAAYYLLESLVALSGRLDPRTV